MRSSLLPHYRPLLPAASVTTLEPTGPRRHFLVLPAAGSGQRMQADLPKQYLSVLGKPLLQHTLERLAEIPCFDRIIVALAPGDPYWSQLTEALPPSIMDRLQVVHGGAERCLSVLNALYCIDQVDADDWVLVHDAVRPCLHPEDVSRLLLELQQEQAGGLLAVPVRETLKQADGQGLVACTVDRKGLWQACTPQMFRYGVLREALEQAVASGNLVTDEAAAVEALGLPVRLVPGRADNLKVTWPEDLPLVAALLQTPDFR